MSYSVQTAKAELSAMLHGTTLSQVENIYGCFNRGARQLLLDIDPTETKILAQMATPLYDGVFDYSAPDDLKGDKVIDLIPQVSRTPRDRISQVYNQEFDIYKDIALVNRFTILHNKGLKTLRVAYNNSSRSISINNADDITSNGTWAASGTGSNLAQDSQTVLNNQSVLKFDMTAGTAYLTNSTMSSVDLTNHLNQSAIFWSVYLPVGTSSDMTSLEIRFGSDSSNYWEKTGITTNFQGNAFVDGWNTIEVLWSATTKVGSPDVSVIDYVRATFVANADVAGVEFGQIWSKLGFITNIEYYSKFLFRNSSTGTWQETVLTDSDLINLDTESYNLFLYQVALACVQQALGQDAGYDTNLFMDKYNQALIRYKQMYKSEVSKPQSTYYSNPHTPYTEYLGRNSINV